jgi:hypothetical protein
MSTARLGSSEAELKLAFRIFDSDGGQCRCGRSPPPRLLSCLLWAHSPDGWCVALALADGAVTCDEIKRLCGTFVTDAEAAQIVKEVDVNGDGVISLQEWIAAMHDLTNKAGGRASVMPSAAAASHIHAHVASAAAAPAAAAAAAVDQKKHS